MISSIFKQLILTVVVCISLGLCNFAFAQLNTGDNNDLTIKVQTKLMADNRVKNLPITINSYLGIVQLAGFVDNQQQVDEAIRIAASVYGVTNVKNCLVLKPSIGGFNIKSR